MKSDSEPTMKHAAKRPGLSYCCVTATATLLSPVLRRMSRANLRKLAKAHGVPVGKDKANTLSNLFSSGRQFSVTISTR